LSYNIRSNGVFVPLAYDSFANSLAKSSQKTVIKPRQSALPGVTQGIQYNPAIQVKSSGWREMIKEILASDTVAAIGGYLGTLATTALLGGAIQAP